MTSLSPRHHRYTFHDYLDLEETSNVRHEFCDGEIFAMAGGSPEHAALAAAVIAALLGQLAGGRCRVFSSDLRVRVLATGLATYPDVTVVCGSHETDPLSPSTVTNPTLVVEVLSDATEEYDRGEKLEHYKKIVSLRSCVLVSQHEPRIEVHTRKADDEWTSEVFGTAQRADLSAVDCSIDGDALYLTALGSTVGGG